MESVSAAIVTLAGAAAFAGAAAHRDGGAMETAGGIGGIFVALTGLFTWTKALDPRERKP